MIEEITAPCFRCTCEHCSFIWTTFDNPYRCPACRTRMWQTKPKPKGSPIGQRKANSLKQSLEAIRLKLSDKTYEEVGELMGFSRQRAQQIIAPTPSARKIVRDRCDSKCEECGNPVINGHIHHISDTGRTEYDYNALDNLQFLCTGCHQNHHHDLKRNRSTGLTVDKVVEIKKLIAGNMTIVSIAKIFKVHKSTIRDIKNGNHWSNVKII